MLRRNIAQLFRPYRPRDGKRESTSRLGTRAHACLMAAYWLYLDRVTFVGAERDRSDFGPGLSGVVWKLALETHHSEPAGRGTWVFRFSVVCEAIEVSLLFVFFQPHG